MQSCSSSAPSVATDVGDPSACDCGFVLLMLGGQWYRELEQQVTMQLQHVGKLTGQVVAQRAQAETLT